jgi:hypothetical protein
MTMKAGPAAKHRVTPALERRVRELRNMGEEIEPELHLVSVDARREWNALQASWPSDSELREGAIALSEERLTTIEAKARRFRDIIRAKRVDDTAAERPQMSRVSWVV